MKGFIELVLIAIILYYAWNFVKKLIFKSIFKFPEPPQNEFTEKKTTKTFKKTVKWDAETVEYEEIKEENKS